jgi:hypothetical protein
MHTDTHTYLHSYIFLLPLRLPSFSVEARQGNLRKNDAAALYWEGVACRCVVSSSVRHPRLHELRHLFADTLSEQPQPWRKRRQPAAHLHLRPPRCDLVLPYVITAFRRRLITWLAQRRWWGKWWRRLSIRAARSRHVGLGLAAATRTHESG